MPHSDAAPADIPPPNARSVDGGVSSIAFSIALARLAIAGQRPHAAPCPARSDNSSRPSCSIAPSGNSANAIGARDAAASSPRIEPLAMQHGVDVARENVW